MTYPLLITKTVSTKKPNRGSTGLKANSFLYFPFIKWNSDHIVEYGLTIFVILLAAYTLFYGIADSALHIWDEAIYANNALDIAMGGDWFVLSVDGESCLYNTKPPLVIWMQAMLIKILGPGMMAIRLPSAISGLGVVLMLLLFSKKSLGDIRYGWLAVLALISSIGYVRYHMTRTGDLDSTLVFWTTAMVLLVFHVLLHPKSDLRKYLLGIILCAFMGYMTKSTAVLLPMLGLFIGSLYGKRIIAILKSKYLYFYGGIAILLVLGYYQYRESLEVGYIDKVWHSEFQRLTVNIMPWHTKPFSFYFKKLFVDGYFMWGGYLLPALFYILWKGTVRNRLFAFLLLAFIIGFIMIISYPHTKIGWYLGPVYPIMSLGVAFVFIRCLDSLKQFWNRSFDKYATIGVVVLSLFLFPLRQVWKQNSDSNPRSPIERPGHALEQLKEQGKLKNLDVILLTDRERHVDQARYYVRSYNQYDKADLRLVTRIEEIDTTRSVLICKHEHLEKTSEVYDLIKTEKINRCSIYKLSASTNVRDK